jgi:hypothetical protein
VSDEEASVPVAKVVRGTASEEELAAVIAVVTDAYTVETEQAVAPVKRVSVWTRTNRGMREPFRRDIPWGRFSG